VAAVVVGMAVQASVGFGFGFFNTPNNRAILTTAPRSRSGQEWAT